MSKTLKVGTHDAILRAIYLLPWDYTRRKDIARILAISLSWLCSDFQILSWQRNQRSRQWRASFLKRPPVVTLETILCSRAALSPVTWITRGSREDMWLIMALKQQCVSGPIRTSEITRASRRTRLETPPERYLCARRQRRVILWDFFFR